MGMIFCLAGSSLFFSGYAHAKRDDPIAEEPSISTAEATIDKTDPSDREHPGGRGANQLILYTPASGERTGTNEWGTEATVIGGIVRTVGGNNSAIPKDGFVLSGHGKGSDWISHSLYPGMEISIKGNKVVARNTERTNLYYADELLKKATAQLEMAGIPDPSISLKELKSLKDESRSLAEKSRMAMQSGDRKKALLLARDALEKARLYLYRSQPSRTKEIRACWYRLREKSPQELESTMKKLADAGFNCLCPETIYWGYAIYPDAHPALRQNPAFSGWDPLKELCALGKKYNIKIIPWVEVYFIGFQDSPLVSEKAEWLALGHDGKQPSSLEKGYYYFCPSREEVRRFWLETYEHLLKTYPIDGLQLDYIRYPQSLPWEEGYCYCGVCRRGFYNRYEVDPTTLDPQKDPEKWRKWNEYRMEQVTDFMKEVRTMQKRVRPDAKLSADVFPKLDEAMGAKFQNWMHWLKMGWLDQIYFMAYTSDAEYLRLKAMDLTPKLSKDVEIITGLAPYMGFSAETLLEEILIAHETGSQGTCLFEYGSLTSEHIHALKEGPFRLPATCP